MNLTVEHVTYSADEITESRRNEIGFERSHTSHNLGEFQVFVRNLSDQKKALAFFERVSPKVLRTLVCQFNKLEYCTENAFITYRFGK